MRLSDQIPKAAVLLFKFLLLESMTEETIPTRAEVSDVANAILDGATHLMLSAETAVGQHPYRVVEMMNQIVRYTEEESAGGG